MRRSLAALAALALIGAGAFGWITAPRPLPADAMAGLTGNPQRGETLFWAGGCASCHAAKNATGPARLALGGGQRLKTPFGTFSVPNISPDPDHGIGRWTARDLADALLRGLAPDGRHLYPVFPYPSYAHIGLQDVADLKAFLDTLPKVASTDPPSEVGFPFGWRRLLGGWDFLFLNTAWAVQDPLSPEEARGRALAEGLGHCGECHTPRNAFGALRRDRWFAGAPNPAGPGKIPNITPAKLDWSQDDIVTYLSTGFTPSFDAAGGDMAEVVENLSHLPKDDLKAISAYLKRVPAQP